MLWTLPRPPALTPVKSLQQQAVHTHSPSLLWLLAEVRSPAYSSSASDTAAASHPHRDPQSRRRAGAPRAGGAGLCRRQAPRGAACRRDPPCLPDLAWPACVLASLPWPFPGRSAILMMPWDQGRLQGCATHESHPDPPPCLGSRSACLTLLKLSNFVFKQRTASFHSELGPAVGSKNWPQTAMISFEWQGEGLPRPGEGSGETGRV